MAKRVEKESVVKALKDSKPGDIIPYQSYKNYMIIEEKSGRVVVGTEHGLYVTEFDSADKAKEYIDNVK
jgi:hypothetical protein